MIHKLTMPKWGLSMTEGKVVAWLAEDGAEVDAGAEVVEIETEKIASGLEVPQRGILRQVSKIGEMAPVGGLIGVIVDGGDSQAEIDAFVAEFQASFVPEEAEEESASAEPETIEVLGKTMRYLKRGEGGDRRDTKQSHFVGGASERHSAPRRKTGNGGLHADSR